MTKPKIVKETAMNLAEVKDELGKIKKRDGELNYRANKTEEYLNTVVKLSGKKVKDFYKALEDLQIPRLREQQLHKIVDTCPQTVKELKVILQGYTVTVSNENMQKVVDVVKEHA